MMTSFPSRAYFICADARTGSSLLADVLRMTGVAGKPFEYFGPAEIDKTWMRRDEMRVPDNENFTDFRSWRDYIIRAGSEYNGVFATTLHWFQLENALSTFESATGGATRPVEVFRDFFPEIRFVWLRRKNIVAQAISHYVAKSTGMWGDRADRPPPDRRIDREAPYNYVEIDKLVAHATVAGKGWRGLLADAWPLTLELTYEELDADIDAAVRKVIAHLGLSLGGASVPLPVLRKQATDWSRELQRRYREERHARGDGPIGDEHEI